MTDADSRQVSAWDDAVVAAAIIATGATHLGGVIVRGRFGPVRERWLALVKDFCGPGIPIRKVPIGVSTGRLLGGLDLAATIKAGRPVCERGVLAEADGGVIILPSAERLERGAAAIISAAIDDGSVAMQRDGFALTFPARIVAVALDESQAEDEAVRVSLAERLALRINLDAIDRRQTDTCCVSAGSVAAARQNLGNVVIGDAEIEALCAAAVALGAGSMRTTCQAVLVARTSAALQGRLAVHTQDLELALRLVLAPRATRLPAVEEEPEDAPDAPEPPEPETPPADDPTDDQQLDAETLKDLVLAAAQAAIPPGLLAALKSGQVRRQSTSGRSGAQKKSGLRGRRLGAIRGDPKSGAPVDLIETLRAAAPWQNLRNQQTGTSGRLQIRRDDLRLKRFETKTETTTVFVVDASGSAALHRLAEAKGAVELMLADCYVRRDSVALIAFRGKTAELLLAPTRSLARAKRNLASLPGGGGTPLASAVEAAVGLGIELRRKGQTPSVVFLTDGRANVGRNGQGGRPRAMEDAVAAARALRLANLAALIIDTSPQPKPEARMLANEMGASYLPLPHADAASMSEAIRRTKRSQS